MFSKKSAGNQTKITPDLQKIIKQLKTSKNKKDCLRRAYDLLSRKYHGRKFYTYLTLHRLMNKNVNMLWEQNGFMHCTNINYVLKFILVNSGFFQETDIKYRWTQMYYLSPHQYLQVKINEREFINVDIWAKVYGVPFGQYASGWRY